jgi:hypothetical protein
MITFDNAQSAEKKRRGKGHSNTAASYNDIAGVYHAQGDNQRALDLYAKLN